MENKTDFFETGNTEEQDEFHEQKRKQTKY